MKRSDPPHECVSIHVASMKNIYSGAFWGQTVVAVLYQNTVAISVASYCSQPAGKPDFWEFARACGNYPRPCGNSTGACGQFTGPCGFAIQPYLKPDFALFLGVPILVFKPSFEECRLGFGEAFGEVLGAFDGLRH